MLEGTYVRTSQFVVAAAFEVLQSIFPAVPRKTAPEAGHVQSFWGEGTHIYQHFKMTVINIQEQVCTGNLYVSLSSHHLPDLVYPTPFLCMNSQT